MSNLSSITRKDEYMSLGNLIATEGPGPGLDTVYLAGICDAQPAALLRADKAGKEIVFQVKENSWHPWSVETLYQAEGIRGSQRGNYGCIGRR